MKPSEKLKIVVFPERRKKTHRDFDKMSTRDRYIFLTKGTLLAKEWIDFKTGKTFYRPKLNGITVNDGVKLKRFNSPELAVEAGKVIKTKIEQFLKTN
jgi:hypothetical protein